MSQQLVSILAFLILLSSCRDAEVETNSESELKSLEQPPVGVAEVLITDLPKLLETGMAIKDAEILFDRVVTKNHSIKQENLVRVYFFHEKEIAGDLVAVDMQVNEGLITSCKFGYRK